MGAKEELLADITRHDSGESVQEIHARLVAAGLKWKGPRNSETLLYFFRLEEKEVGVAAMRRGIFSFPAPFWRSRATALRRALDMVPSYHLVGTEPAISSSQYSAGQVQVSAGTLEAIIGMIDSVILPEARKAGAALA